MKHSFPLTNWVYIIECPFIGTLGKAKTSALGWDSCIEIFSREVNHWFHGCKLNFTDMS